MTSQKPSLFDTLIQNARTEGLATTEAFAGKDLAGQNLSEKPFGNFNLRGTMFNGAILCRVNFNGANLSNAQLRGADLTGAELRGANLTGADLEGANLRGVDFSGATLTKVIVKGAELSANIGLSKELLAEWKKQGAKCEGYFEQPQSRWWLQFVLIPILVALIGSGFMGLWKVSPNQRIPEQSTSAEKVG
jgi:uncharacterized protein YjbI with pentapeptide repeats